MKFQDGQNSKMVKTCYYRNLKVLHISSDQDLQSTKSYNTDTK